MKKYSIPMIVSVDKLEGPFILVGAPPVMGPVATFSALFKGDTANIKKKSAMIKKEMKIDMRR